MVTFSCFSSIFRLIFLVTRLSLFTGRFCHCLMQMNIDLCRHETALLRNRGSKRQIRAKYISFHHKPGLFTWKRVLTRPFVFEFYQIIRVLIMFGMLKMMQYLPSEIGRQHNIWITQGYTFNTPNTCEGCAASVKFKPKAAAVLRDRTTPCIHRGCSNRYIYGGLNRTSFEI